MSVLEVTDLHKSYGNVKALNGVSFSVNAGEIVGFLGPNGAGKSTTIKLILGLLRRDKGEIKIFGENELSKASLEKIALIPDAEVPHISGRMFLMQTARYYPNPKEQIKKAAKAVGATYLLKKNMRHLSKGQKQRIKIANALIGDPELIIADEPTSGLDPTSRMQLLSLFQQQADEGRTIFFSSHVLSEVEQLSNRLLVINKGEISYSGSLTDLSDVLGSTNTYRVLAKGLTEGKLKQLPHVESYRILSTGLVEIVGDSSTPNFLKPLIDDKEVEILRLSRQDIDLTRLFTEEYA